MAQQKRGKSTNSSMKRNTAPTQREQRTAKTPRRREVAAVICFILAAFSFIGYWSADGAFIGFFIGIIKGLIGHGYYTLPPVLLFCTIILTFHRGRPVRLRVFCVFLLAVMTGSLVHLFIYEGGSAPALTMFGELWQSGTQLSSGGAVSGALSVIFMSLFGFAGALVVVICVCVFVLMVSFNITIAGLVDAYRRRERREYVPEDEPEWEPAPEKAYKPPVVARAKRSRKAIDIPLDAEGPPQPDISNNKPEDVSPDANEQQMTTDEPPIEQMKDASDAEPDASASEIIEDLPLDIPFMEGYRGKTAARSQARKARSNAKLANQAPRELDKHSQAKLYDQEKIDALTGYKFPPLSLLSLGTPKSRAGDDEVRLNSERLESAFRSFGVNVNITNATRGPAVTRYEAELEAGVKLSKLTGLADDIALSLGTIGVRIAAMSNKISTVGIEVPNKNISTVSLRDIIESKTFTEAKSKLTFAIGMDISGDAIVGNIAKLPHMLIAGTTGSGKSVCLNSIILSILYKATPQEVRFIMIDPKMVEFRVYNSIPHLLVPVVTDVKKAAGALQWAVYEMMKRYSLFSDANARDLEGYNNFASKSDEHEPLPQIVVVIDELADLMLTAAKEVEESVCRVAQMGRASGMHLVIATQSPRADVITGLMKANIPSRISFKVASALESRIILDAGGNADKLVGRGDMLYAPIGSIKPMRVQGTWVSDKERESVVDYIKKSADPNYSEEVISEIEKAALSKPSGDKPKEEQQGEDRDELLPQAVDVIFETGQASVSMLQRRLKLGYARAARIVDQMEQMGIVGQFEGSKPRTMLITKEQWSQMQYIEGTAPLDGVVDS